jgi:hypothetical protein
MGNILLAGIGLWVLALCSRKGFWPVFKYWALTMTGAIIGMAYGGWI